MKTKILFLGLLMILLFSSCFRNRLSYISNGEDVVVNFRHAKENPKMLSMTSVPVAEVAVNNRGIGMLVAPYVLKTGYTITKKLIDKNKARAVAIYSASNSDDKFYKNINLNSEINLETIDIVRFIDSKSTNRDTATLIRFKIEVSADGKFMRLAPIELLVNYTKARLNSSDKTLDMDVNIAVDASWVGKDADMNISELFKTDLTFRNIPLRKRFQEQELSKYKSAWVPLIPRSFISENSFGYGNYCFKIKVTEYDNYAKRIITEEKVPQFNEYIDKTKEVIDQIQNSKQNQNEE